MPLSSPHDAAGDSLRKHPCIGSARRLMVGDRSRQPQVRLALTCGMG